MPVLLPQEQNWLLDTSGDTTLSVPIQTTRPIPQLSIQLVSGDGDVVKQFSMSDLSPGQFSLTWDGKDDNGHQVPDEAYTFVFQGTDKSGNSFTLDPRQSSGGELLQDLNTRVLENGHISYQLTKPSRVMIRAGIRGGPLVNSILTWSPRTTGSNIQAWNGFDHSNVEYLLGNPDLRVLVVAYALPNATVITTGNPSTDYFSYRKKRGFPDGEINPEAIVSQRNGQRISPFFFMPVSLAQEPELLFSMKESPEVNEAGRYVLDKPVTVTVDLSAKDQWLMQQSQYEISFFVDHKFVAEEETGYTPLSWRFDPQTAGPGKHVFSINLAGLWGHVGVYSFLFEVPEIK
ncbi:hypothetical protein NF212_09300 [Parasalinivibrio latis]